MYCLQYLNKYWHIRIHKNMMERQTQFASVSPLCLPIFVFHVASRSSWRPHIRTVRDKTRPQKRGLRILLYS